MATAVDNPFDTQQAKPKNGGIIANAAQAPAAYMPEKSEVDRATQTTQGQLDSILSGDSPLMQRARTVAKQQMNGRGLLNSTMMGEAGTASMIDRALPIAKADADVYGGRAEFNANAANTAKSQGANIAAQMGLQQEAQEFQKSESALDREQQERLQESKQQFEGEQADLDRQQKIDLQESQQRFQEIQGRLDREQQLEITELQSSLQEAVQQRSLPHTFAMNIAGNSQNAIQQILGNAELEPEAKRAAIANVIASANAQIRWISTFYDTPIPDIQKPGAADRSIPNSPPAGR